MEKFRRNCAFCCAKRNIDRLKDVWWYYFCDIASWMYSMPKKCYEEEEVITFFKLKNEVSKLSKMARHIRF